MKKSDLKKYFTNDDDLRDSKYKCYMPKLKYVICLPTDCLGDIQVFAIEKLSSGKVIVNFTDQQIEAKEYKSFKEVDKMNVYRSPVAVI